MTLTLYILGIVMLVFFDWDLCDADDNEFDFWRSLMWGFMWPIVAVLMGLIGIGVMIFGREDKSLVD